MQLKIFQAGLEHLEAAAGLFNDYRQFYQFPADLPAARDYLKMRISRGDSHVFLATIEAATVGFMQLYPSFSSLSLKPVWILYDLFVAPAGRKSGVATSLLERARQLGVDTGASEISLATAHNNLSAQRVYERTGWQRDEEFYYYTLVI